MVSLWPPFAIFEVVIVSLASVGTRESCPAGIQGGYNVENHFSVDAGYKSEVCGVQADLVAALRLLLATP